MLTSRSRTPRSTAVDGGGSIRPNANVTGPLALTYTVSGVAGEPVAAKQSIVFAAVEDRPVLGTASDGPVLHETANAAFDDFGPVTGTIAVTDPDAGDIVRTAAIVGKPVVLLNGKETSGLISAALLKAADGGSARSASPRRRTARSAGPTIRARRCSSRSARTSLTIAWTVTASDGMLDAAETRTITVTVHGADDLFTGTADDDQLVGTAWADTILGLGGDDGIVAGAGNDTIDGDDGDDAIMAGAGNDVVDGGEGDDTIDGGSGNDVLRGGSGNDTINGGSGNDTIWVGSGDAVVNGGSDTDTLVLDGAWIQMPSPRRDRRGCWRARRARSSPPGSRSSVSQAELRSWRRCCQMTHRSR
ncbi:calcium-binding protein [Sphingomonas sp. MMS24-JH45]